jgi:hypothetical protein
VEPYAAVPTLLFGLRVAEASGIAVEGVLLRVQVRIEPGRRPYSASEAERLYELFGHRAQWPDTVKPLLWTHTSTNIPAFQRHVDVDLPVTCTYGLEVAGTKYFHGLGEGDIPLLFLFSGTAFVRTGEGFSVEQIPWECEAAWRLPVAAWREAMDRYFPSSAWLRLSRGTVDRLQAYKCRHAHPTWESAIESLLGDAEGAKLT